MIKSQTLLRRKLRKRWAPKNGLLCLNSPHENSVSRWPDRGMHGYIDVLEPARPIFQCTLYCIGLEVPRVLTWGWVFVFHRRKPIGPEFIYVCSNARTPISDELDDRTSVPCHELEMEWFYAPRARQDAVRSDKSWNHEPNEKWTVQCKCLVT